MFVEKLTLYNFRNFKEFSTNFSNQVNFIIGGNAQGKTNLIEAINLISTTHSFRTSTIKDLVNLGQTEMSVCLNLFDNNGKQELCFSFSQNGRKQYVNGEKKSATEFISRLCCVVFTPTDLGLIKGTPDGRRKFIDRHIADIDNSFIKNLLEYNRALKSKNIILKSSNPNPQMLQVWNELMAKTAININKARKNFLTRLEETANETHKVFSSQDGLLSLKLKSNINSKEELTEDELLKVFNSNLQKEIVIQSCLIGPHRDDIIIKIGDRDVKAFASQGQTRSVVLSLKLGVINILEKDRQDQPILLLDDVDSELDEYRRREFFEYILSSPRQVFITGTNADIIKLCSTTCQTMYLRDGVLEKE